MGPGRQHFSQGLGGGLGTWRENPGHPGEKGQAICHWTSVWENPQPLLPASGKEVRNHKVAIGICGVLTCSSRGAPSFAFSHTSSDLTFHIHPSGQVLPSSLPVKKGASKRVSNCSLSSAAGTRPRPQAGLLPEPVLFLFETLAFPGQSCGRLLPAFAFPTPLMVHTT